MDAIKVIHNPRITAFPCIMRNKISGTTIIAIDQLRDGSYVGTVIGLPKEDSMFYIGYYSDTWHADNFVPCNSTVILKNRHSYGAAYRMGLFRRKSKKSKRVSDLDIGV